MHKDKQKKDFLVALGSSLGNISDASKSVNISRRTIYNWRNEDDDFDKAIDDVKEGLIDLAESKLLQKINEGHLTAIIFYLKTQGQKRGYIESNHLSVDQQSKDFVDYKLKYNQYLISVGLKPFLGENGRIHAGTESESLKLKGAFEITKAAHDLPDDND